MSGYVCAGFETLSSIIDEYMKAGEEKGFDDHFSREDICEFFGKTCNKFLHSFGQNFTGKKKEKTHMDSEERTLQACKNTGFFEKSEIILDSGGFQVSIGRIDRDETDKLIRMYHQFLTEYSHLYDRAFVLDLPPGDECTIFHNFTEVYEKNLETYRIAANLPEEVKKKMIFILHFRTPKLWDIYMKIMRENDLFKHFNFHGTGGIVANMKSDFEIPCIIYTIPMVPLINEAIRHGRKYLNFHILGGSNFRDILFYELFKHLVKKRYDIELEITFDSSGLFKALMRGRYLNVYDLDGKTVRKLDIRTFNLDNRFYETEIRVRKRFCMCLKELSEEFGFKDISGTKIYDDQTNTFFGDVRIYSMLYMLYMFEKVERSLKEKAERLIDIYYEDKAQFCREISEETRFLNSRKITKKQKAKARNILGSMRMLENLDEDYCRHVVEKSLSKDEFKNLLNNQRVMKW